MTLARTFVVSAFVVAIGCFASSPTALAQASSDDGDDKDDAAKPPKPRLTGKAARKEARRLFLKGQRLLRAEKFEEGVAAIESAYDLDPRVEHLYNLGAAHHLKGDRRKALEYYRKVLANGSNGRLSKLARRFTREIEREIAAEEAAEKERQARAEAKKRAKEAARARRKAERQAKKARSTQKKLEAELRISRARTRRARAQSARFEAIANARGGGRGKRVVGSILMLAGGGALGVAAAYGLVARQADSEVEGLTPGEDEWAQGLEDIGQDADRRFLISSIAGGTLFLIGLTAYILGERDARKTPDPGSLPDVALSPALGPGGAGVQVFGRF